MFGHWLLVGPVRTPLSPHKSQEKVLFARHLKIVSFILFLDINCLPCYD
jgi:hypothetical protein